VTIDGLAEEPIPVGAGRLRGRENAYRIRIGNYRIVYEVHVTEVVVYVVGVAHRREIYHRILEPR
jgi:mRNA interferase RelE/StbE